MKRIPTLAILALLHVQTALAGCLPISEAGKNIGGTVCVTGKVVKVSSSPRSGTQFLNFCEDYRKCPFTVVIFARDLRDVGDVRWLEGKMIEIHGKVREYNGKAEIILKNARQLRGEAAGIPALPKNFDVEKHGDFSAGRFQTPKKPRKSRRNKRGLSDAAGEASPAPPEEN